MKQKKGEESMCLLLLKIELVRILRILGCKYCSLFLFPISGTVGKICGPIPPLFLELE